MNLYLYEIMLVPLLVVYQWYQLFFGG